MFLLAEKTVPIGSIGISLEDIYKDETGLAVFPKYGEVRITALENLQKHVQVIVVEQVNKCKEHRLIERKPKTWNAYRKFNLAPDEEKKFLEVNGEATLVSVAITVDGTTAKAVDTTVKFFHDKEPHPSLKFKISELKVLGGTVPTVNPKGGMTVENTTEHIYSGFINPDSAFRTNGSINIKNGDPDNTVTVDVFALFSLKQTETQIFIKGGVTGGEGGEPTDPSKDVTKPVGGGCPTIYSWNGREYVEEGLLNIHASSDITVTHKLKHLKPQGKIYKLLLRELDEYTSHINNVRLYDEKHECTLVKALHSRNGNVTQTLTSQNERIDLKPKETLELNFTSETNCCSPFTFEIKGYNVKIVES